MSAIEIRHLRKYYQNTPVLDDLNLTLEYGSCVGILGANGSGKTTLLSILAGVGRASGGSFRLEGKPGYLPQNNPLFEELTVYDNLRLYYPAKALKKDSMAAEIPALAVDRYLKKRVRDCSGGMKRRVAFLAAISSSPSILLLDEPTSALDQESRETIYRYLRGFVGRGGLVLLVTHDISELHICTRCLLMRDGKLRDRNDGDLS